MAQSTQKRTIEAGSKPAFHPVGFLQASCLLVSCTLSCEPDEAKYSQQLHVAQPLHQKLFTPAVIRVKEH